MVDKGNLMAKFQFEGIDNYIAQLEKLYGDTEKIAGKAVYDGAGVVMKYVLQGIDSIAVDNRYGTEENPCSGPSSYEKEGLYRSVGIAKARYDGTFYNVKIGFDGYDEIKTKTWPNGRPHSMIARSIQSGTSWMQKQPFMRKAEQAARGPCELAMAEAVEKEIQKIMN